MSSLIPSHMANDANATIRSHHNQTMNDPASAMKMMFGARLRAVRIAYGYKSAREMAERIGEDQNTYSMWERGQRYPPPEKLLKIIQATGATSDYLYFGFMDALPVKLASALDGKQSVAQSRSDQQRLAS